MNGAKVVLVVDDEPDIRDAVELALSLEGYAVKSAPDRETALKVIKESQPVLILLDYRMPGLDAGEFVKQVQSSHPDATIVLMSAIKDAGEQARQLGLSHWLAKPFELTELLDLARQYTA